MIEIDDQIWLRNLESLGRWNGAAREVLRGVELPGDWEVVHGRGGGVTFARRSLDGESIEWLGGTSMPGESAGAMVAAMELGQGNGLGAGIGTGFEWRALVGRMNSSQMLFVLETGLAAVRMALSTCDLADLLASGRIILLAGATAGEQLAEFLERHAGFDPPMVIHPLPTLGGQRRNMLLGMGEGMIRSVVGRRALVVAERAEMVGGMKEVHEKTVLVMGLAAAGTERPIFELARAMDDAGAEVHELAVDHFATASLLARLEMVWEQRPGIIFSDLFRGQLNMVLPGAVGVYTFVPARPGVGYWRGDNPPASGLMGTRDRVICHAEAHRARLLEMGYSAEQVKLVALAVESGRELPGKLASGKRVAILADVPGIDPAAYGFDLPSHQQVWQAAAEIIGEEIFRLHPGMVKDIYQRALRRARALLEEGAVAESLERGIRDVLMAAVPYWALVKQLVEAGVAVKLVGAGWENVPGPYMGVMKGPALMTCRWGAEAWEEVAVVLHYSADGTVHPGALEAAFQGVAVVGGEHPWDGKEGSLGTILRAGTDYVGSAGGQVVAALRGVLRDEGRREKLVRAAGKHLLAEHTWERRAKTVLAV